jgi:F1F0 ATPase subunit 2
MDGSPLARAFFVDADVADLWAAGGLYKRMDPDQEGPAMNPIALLSRMLAGMALGGFFYLGLWLTVRQLVPTRHPVLLTVASFWIRTLVVLAGFLYLMRGHWQYAIACLIGFVMGRMAVSIPLRMHHEVKA